MRKQVIIHAYPWTLTDPGLEKALDEIQEAGITGINVTPHYHQASYFTPSNPRRKLYYGEAGRASFVPDESRYEGRTLIRPRVSEIVEGERYFHEITEKIHARGLDLHFWTVYYYSHERARDYPQCATMDAFGHVHPSDLNPMNPDARGYALALTEDLVANYEPDGIYLESLGFHRFGHGWGGMKGFTQLRPKDRFLLNVDFGPDSIRQTSQRGVDAEALRSEVREHLERSLLEPPEQGDTELVTAAWLGEAFGGKLMAYSLAQQELVTSLFEEVVAIGRQAGKRPLLFSMGVPAEEGRWESGMIASRIRLLLGQVHTGLPEPSQAKKEIEQTRGIMPPGCQVLGTTSWGSFSDPEQIIPAMEGWIEAGGDGFTCLTYGLLRPYQWDTLRKARHLWS